MIPEIKDTQTLEDLQTQLEDKTLHRMLLRLRLKGIPASGTIPLAQHKRWLNYNELYYKACVKSLGNNPTAPFPTWPVMYKGITWTLGEEFKVNGEPVKDHLRIVKADPA